MLVTQMSYQIRAEPQSSLSLTHFCAAEYNPVSISENILVRLCLREGKILRRSDSAAKKRRKECSWVTGGGVLMDE